MKAKRLYLRFIGGPLGNRDQEYVGDSVNGPRTWMVRQNDVRNPGYYERQGSGPDANGVIKMKWQEKDF